MFYSWQVIVTTPHKVVRSALLSSDDMWSNLAGEQSIPRSLTDMAKLVRIEVLSLLRGKNPCSENKL